jgi:KaiB-like protein
LNQAAARGTDRRGKPWVSQPEGGGRFTSQAGRGLGGTLDHLPTRPVHPIQVGGSRRHHIDVVDLLKIRAPAAYEQILAVPTLAWQLPLPVRKVVGDLAGTNQLLAGLQLQLPASDTM